jgi:hypothetical protein
MRISKVVLVSLAEWLGLGRRQHLFDLMTEGKELTGYMV